MKRVVVFVVAFSMLFVGAPTQSDAGVIAGVATEWTQILNHVQLIQSYIRQGLQLANDLKHYELALKESLVQPNQVFGVIQQDLGQLAQLVQGHALRLKAGISRRDFLWRLRALGALCRAGGYVPLCLGDE